MAASVFISYGHDDQHPVDWLERLRDYLAQFRQRDAIDVWADSRIEPGSKWQEAIGSALNRANAAILLVGPMFLGSQFIATEELPKLLDAAARRGCHLYPLVIRYCSYHTSMLAPYQAFNDPGQPLEALAVAEQNRILNDLSIRVDGDVRGARTASADPAGAPARGGGDVRQTLREIARTLGDTSLAFGAQVARRNELVAMIGRRLEVERLEYERFFQRYYPSLVDAERFVFDQVRAITEGPLHDGNQRILTLIEQQPEVLDAVPGLVALRQHVVFWLNKYDKVFTRRPDMCLLYTGVEDGVPFPAAVDREVAAWLEAHAQ
jgi:TIR domain